LQRRGDSRRNGSEAVAARIAAELAGETAEVEAVLRDAAFLPTR
jgi:hypothetical protein